METRAVILYEYKINKMSEYSSREMSPMSSRAQSPMISKALKRPPTFWGKLGRLYNELPPGFKKALWQSLVTVPIATGTYILGSKRNQAVPVRQAEYVDPVPDRNSKTVYGAGHLGIPKNHTSLADLVKYMPHTPTPTPTPSISNPMNNANINVANKDA